MEPFPLVASLGVVLPLLVASTAAQSSRPKRFVRAPAPTRQVTLDLGTGVYTRGPIVKDRGATTIADFQNADAIDGAGFGWLSTDTGGGSCRWFSAASKGAGVNQSTNASDLMSDVFFYYCSDALDVKSGGAGGSATLGFYEGYTLYGGAPTTTAALVALTGMPADSAEGGHWGPDIGRCYGIRVVFPALVAFSDGQFVGYSWEFDDVGTDGVVAATNPFISCVVSCSGTNVMNGNAGGIGTATGLGEDGQGMLDAMDQFCVAPSVSSTFTFGTTGTPFAPTTRTSLNMEIREAADLATTNVSYNATVTPNADTLSATSAVLGSTWTATLTKAAPSGPGTIQIVVASARHPNPNGGGNGIPQLGMPLFTGRALIAGTFLAYVLGAHDGTSGTASAPIPLSFAFCGFHFAAQCRTSGGGGGLRLSSAVEGTIGTF